MDYNDSIIIMKDLNDVENIIKKLNGTTINNNNNNKLIIMKYNTMINYKKNKIKKIDFKKRNLNRFDIRRNFIRSYKNNKFKHQK
jgi:hypothetical protein